MLTKYQNTRVPGYTYVDRVPQVRDTAEAAMATVSSFGERSHYFL